MTLAVLAAVVFAAALSGCGAKNAETAGSASDEPCSLRDSSELKALPAAITDVYATDGTRRDEAREAIHAAAQLDTTKWDNDTDTAAAKKTAAALNKFADKPPARTAGLKYLTNQVTTIGTRLEKAC